MGTSWNSWNKSQQEIENTTSWEQSTVYWKASNILGWSLSTVGGASTSFFGALRTQLYFGLERKVNFAKQYQWQWLESTRIMLNGQKVIDLKDKENMSAKQALKCTFSRGDSMYAELMSGDSKETVVNTKTESYGTHAMTCITGGSTETIPLGSKDINALIGPITLNCASGASAVTVASNNVEIKAMAGSVTVAPESITISALTINIG